jgi:hypothetical protein
MITTLRYLWAVRPRSARAQAHIARRNAADPQFWEEMRAAGGAFTAALKGGHRG